MKKIVLIIMVLLMASNSWAVIVTGSGSTKEEAIGNGLREAVEMYTSTLVYGVTDVENYSLLKDSVVASSLGYVKNYRVVKTSKIDDMIIITLDVNVSEDKIDVIFRDNINLMTYEDVLRDYNNVTQRQEQIKKLAEMVKILYDRPAHEKYGVIYEGYEIKRIGATRVDLILNTRITLNPFYSKAYNEILKNLSEPEDSSATYLIGGKYYIQNGRLANAKYPISRDTGIPYIDTVRAQVHVNDEPVDQCREYRDNLMVVYSPTEFAKIFITQFPKTFKRKFNNEPSDIDPKWENRGIKKSKIIPPEGLPLKINYTITDSADIKSLWQLKLTLKDCKKR